MNPIEATKKTCFVIGPMKVDADIERQKRLTKMVGEAFKSLKRDDFDVTTPVIEEGGDIVQQVMGRLDQAEVVVADLTGNNPSVLYELAVRHCTGLPCVHVRHKGGEGPQGPLAFDVAHDRCVDVDLDAAVADHKGLANMLASALKEVELPLNQSKNPVMAYFKVPLTDVYPASGIAKGYCENFVVRTAKGVATAKRKKLPIRVKVPDVAKPNNAAAVKWNEGQSLDVAEWQEIDWVDKRLDLTKEQWNTVTLTIWVPDKVKYIDRNAFLKRTADFYEATIFDPDKEFRDISALLHRKTLQIIDIPTTLTALTTSGKKQLNLEREFTRFEKALNYWKGVSIEREQGSANHDEAHTQFLEHSVRVGGLPEAYKDKPK